MSAWDHLRRFFHARRPGSESVREINRPKPYFEVPFQRFFQKILRTAECGFEAILLPTAESGFQRLARLKPLISRSKRPYG